MSLVKEQFTKLDLQAHKGVDMAVTYQEYDRGVTKGEFVCFFPASKLH